MTSRPASPPRRLPAGRRLLAGLAALAACAPADPPSTTADERPDIVLVVIDTLRADRLSAYGYPRPTSPHLDALAARGALFEDVTAQSSWTLPSMASLFSGRRLFVNATSMPPGLPTVAERLEDTGYETAAFFGNPALTATDEAGYVRGFGYVADRDTTGHGNWDAPDLGRAVDDWLASHPPGDAPRFTYLHFFDPHWPYDPQDDAPLPGEVRVRDDVLEAWVDAAADDPVVTQFFDRDRLGILEWLDAYDREIRITDAEIARLLDELARPEREQLVVVASDHGEGLWDHRHHEVVYSKRTEPNARTLSVVFFRDHSYHMFQELVFTPLLVAGPGFEGGHRIARPVENVDIAPTLLRAAGLPDDATLDGLPLQDVVAGVAPDKPFVYSHAKEATLVRRTSDGMKLVNPTDTGYAYEMPLMLFDLGADPHERRNLAARGADGLEVDAEHLGPLRKLVNERERVAGAFDLYPAEADGAVDQEQLDVLRALGYIDVEGPSGDREAEDGAAAPDGDRAPDGR